MNELIMQTISSTLIGVGTGTFVVQWGLFHYKKVFKALGDENGSIKIDGRWYVIKREGE